jgi:hypothetical protein
MSEEAPIDRATVQGQLEALVERRLTLDSLRRWFTPFLAGTRQTVEQDEPLLFSIAFLFEDESLSETAHWVNADRLIRAFRDLEANAALMELIPIIIGQDRLCHLVAKFQSGTITRTGYLSAISNTRYSRGVKAWLNRSDPAELARLCESLDNCRYSESAAILGFA